MAKGGSPAPAPEPELPFDLSGGAAVFIVEKDGSMFWFISNGAGSYYRRVPEGLRQNVPESMQIQDPNGDWLRLWEVRG
jgi:hypothetical protein